MGRFIVTTFLAALIGILVPLNASAEFGNIRRVFSGTAYTLDEGELTVGIFSPLQYGVIDRVTVATHPILDLLLTPNLAVRFKVVDHPKVAFAISANYQQSFISVMKKNVPGSAAVYTTVSVPFIDAVALSFQTGYSLDIEPIRHGFMYGANIGWLVGQKDLLWLAVQGRYLFGQGAEIPTTIIAYTHAWYQLRLSVGIAIGNFPTQVGLKSSDILKFPVYPIIDVWWLL
ncbi:MAG: hypothetical protein ACOX51_00415 [Myxococcota bacterium]|jgi:hypothetical protein|nr:hypothetical protein [Myxococcota bacterium]MBP8971010.1 hypothetical protein [Myxococcota bacterium]HQC44251.1 hypothetical protein [Myxococcota bacterium]HQL57293.1 hypothetical protein [Myxococcota bacterium]